VLEVRINIVLRRLMMTVGEGTIALVSIMPFVRFICNGI